MDQPMVETVQVDAFFKCPLCDGLLRSATVINECLHRFCRRCIMDYFRADQDNNCPICRVKIANPLQTLKSDLTFQRLVYKVFPKHFQDQIACKSSPRSLTITNESTDEIHLQTMLNVYLEYWNIALDFCSNEESELVTKSYLQCIADTPLSCIEKILRLKYSLPCSFQVDLFYQNFVLNTAHERLIDVCRCFDIVDKNSPVNIRFVISPYGYEAILRRLVQSKQPAPSSIESTIRSSSSSSSSIDSTLKVKICRSQSSTSDWYIPQWSSSWTLREQNNSQKNIRKTLKRSSSLKKKSRPRIRFSPSTFDHVHHHSYPHETCPSTAVQQTSLNRKSICKVPPYIPEICSMIISPPSLIKALSIDQLFDVTRTIGPLDLSLK